MAAGLAGAKGIDAIPLARARRMAVRDSFIVYMLLVVVVGFGSGLSSIFAGAQI